jgi:hypothetical protein
MARMQHPDIVFPSSCTKHIAVIKTTLRADMPSPTIDLHWRGKLPRQITLSLPPHPATQHPAPRATPARMRGAMRGPDR